MQLGSHGEVVGMVKLVAWMVHLHLQLLPHWMYELSLHLTYFASMEMNWDM
jgi:hypothetical protein